MAMRVCTSEDCPCSSHNLRYLLYIGEFVLYTRDLVSGTEAEERGRKVEKVLSHGGIRLEPKVTSKPARRKSRTQERGELLLPCLPNH